MRFIQRPLRILKNQAGFSLIEVLVSIALLGTIGAAFLGAIGTSSRVLAVADRRDTAQKLAETQMEYIKGMIYSSSYTPAAISSEYSGYSAAVTCENVTARGSQIQKVIVVISLNDEEVYSLEDFKVQ